MGVFFSELGAVKLFFDGPGSLGDGIHATTEEEGDPGRFPQAFFQIPLGVEGVLGEDVLQSLIGQFFHEGFPRPMVGEVSGALDDLLHEGPLHSREHGGFGGATEHGTEDGLRPSGTSEAGQGSGNGSADSREDTGFYESGVADGRSRSGVYPIDASGVGFLAGNPLGGLDHGGACALHPSPDGSANQSSRTNRRCAAAD